MKKYLLLITAVIFLCAFLPVLAQDLQIGVIAGINFASLTEKGYEQYHTIRTCGGAGGVVELGLNKKLSICLEPLYMQKGGNKLGTEFELAYFEVPVFVKFHLQTDLPRIYLKAGPALGIVLSSKMDVSGLDGSTMVEINDIMKTYDYGMLFGGGVSFAIGNSLLFFEGRYALGLADIIQEGKIVVNGQEQASPEAEMKTRGFQVMAGMTFPIQF